MFADDSLESRLAELKKLRDLPWLDRLDAGELAELVVAYEGASAERYRSGQDAPIEEVLTSWEKIALAKPARRQE